MTGRPAALPQPHPLSAVINNTGVGLNCVFLESGGFGKENYYSSTLYNRPILLSHLAITSVRQKLNGFCLLSMSPNLLPHMSDFEAEIHQNRFRLRLNPDPGGSLSAP